MTQLRSRVHPLFLLAAFSGVLFCITTLTMLVLPWMEPATPVTRWLEANALPLIASEVAATLIAGVAGLCFDQSQTPLGPAVSHSTVSDSPQPDKHEPQSPGGS